MTSKVELSSCPHCGGRSDSVSEIVRAPASGPENRPSPGSLSLCVVCGQINSFDERLRLIRATKEDFENYRKNAPKELDMLRTAQITLLAMIKERRRNNWRNN